MNMHVTETLKSIEYMQLAAEELTKMPVCEQLVENTFNSVYDKSYNFITSHETVAKTHKGCPVADFLVRVLRNVDNGTLTLHLVALNATVSSTKHNYATRSPTDFISENPKKKTATKLMTMLTNAFNLAQQSNGDSDYYSNITNIVVEIHFGWLVLKDLPNKQVLKGEVIEVYVNEDYSPPADAVADVINVVVDDNSNCGPGAIVEKGSGDPSVRSKTDGTSSTSATTFTSITAIQLTKSTAPTERQTLKAKHKSNYPSKDSDKSQ